MTPDELIAMLAAALRAMVASCAEHKCGLRCADEALAAHEQYAKAEGVERRTWWNVERHTQKVGWLGWDCILSSESEARSRIPGTRGPREFRIVRVDETRTVIADSSPAPAALRDAEDLVCRSKPADASAKASEK